MSVMSYLLMDPPPRNVTLFLVPECVLTPDLNRKVLLVNQRLLWNVARGSETLKS